MSPKNWVYIGLALGGVLLVSNAMAAETAKENGIPETWDALFKKYGSKYGIPWKRLKRHCWIESSMGKARSVAEGLRNPANISSSTSSDGLSWGLMQVTLATALQFDKQATAYKLNNPEYSIEMACKVIQAKKKYFTETKKFSPTEQEEVMAYNMGEGNVARWHELQEQGKLKSTDFPAGRDYWSKYLTASKLIP